eukprot:364634-Chlamydomonas_euryale.AAC.5
MGASIKFQFAKFAAWRKAKIFAKAKRMDCVGCYIRQTSILTGTLYLSCFWTQELALPSGFVCRPFATTHTVPSQGYVLYRKPFRSSEACVQGQTLTTPKLKGTGPVNACGANNTENGYFAAWLLTGERPSCCAKQERCYTLHP